MCLNSAPSNGSSDLKYFAPPEWQLPDERLLYLLSAEILTYIPCKDFSFPSWTPASPATQWQPPREISKSSSCWRKGNCRKTLVAKLHIWMEGGETDGEITLQTVFTSTISTWGSTYSGAEITEVSFMMRNLFLIWQLYFSSQIIKSRWSIR